MRDQVRSVQYLQQLLLVLLAAAAVMTIPPPAAAAGAPPNGYNCSSDRSIYPCQSYAFYRAGANADLLDLASIADLFGVSRLSIARSSGLSPAATNLTYGQPLLIPLHCSCGAATNRSYAAVAYQIVQGDTFYGLSTFRFGNLTAFPSVEDVNPSLVPTDLQIGTMAILPIFCQCPSTAAAAGVPGLSPGLVTYVFQPSDTYSTLANRFGTNVTSLIALNGPEAGVKQFSPIVVPVTQIPPPLLKTSNSTLIAAPPPPAPAAGGSTIIEKRDRKGAVIGLALALGVVMALAAAMAAAMWRRRREYQGRVKGEEWRGKGGERRYGRNASDDRLMADISEWLDKYRVYGIDELREATDDFDQSRLIDGSVYKGAMDGEVYAIKKMKWNARDELKILQKVNHTNLVKLEGFCIEPDAGTCYLVYEYVENGSLHSWLHPSSSSSTATPRGTLDWRSRLRIALDLANGLQYIHEHTWPRVVHKDIKSSNVLLDAHMHAKIANFGLARSGCNAVTTHIVGTQGYIAPEYLADGLVTTKMDVFAYGVVLLELVSGREAVNPSTGEALWVQAEAEGVLEAPPRSGRLAAWMDPALAEQSFPAESVAGVLGVAKACLHRDPSRRPSMVDVAYTLSKADEQFSDFSEEGPLFGSGPVTAR